MKYVLIALLFFPLYGFSTEACKVILPLECQKIVDSEFSTGVGDKLWIIEIGCELKDGSYKKFLASRLAPTSLLGSFFSRWVIPKEITFEKGKAKEADMKCD